MRCWQAQLGERLININDAALCNECDAAIGSASIALMNRLHHRP
jgi:hypothetical protein